MSCNRERSSSPARSDASTAASTCSLAMTEAEVQAFRTENHIAIVDTLPTSNGWAGYNDWGYGNSWNEEDNSVASPTKNKDCPPCPHPIVNFAQAAKVFPDSFIQKFTAAGFKAPSPIQSQAWPVALSGRDLIGIAETGSGKTLSFALPAALHISKQTPLLRGESGPFALVLAPTRELVQQIQAECEKFLGKNTMDRGFMAMRSKGKGKGGYENSNSSNSSIDPETIRTVALVGGMPKGPQIKDLCAGAEMIVATPGRLLDLLNMDLYSCKFNLDKVSFLCLDEADRMLDMGFEKPLRDICDKIPKANNRQNVFFSATWPKEVQKLAKELCTGSHPIQINIGEGVGQSLKANPRVEQNVEVFSPDMGDLKGSIKPKRLKEILDQEHKDGNKIILFCKTKRDCDDVAWMVQRDLKYNALAIHGDKEQQERDWALTEFKKPGSCAKNNYNILVATDVAARGLDVKNVSCVINYDFPMNVEDYVHRIGRTGRAGTYGKSYTFFVPTDLKNAARSSKELVKIMRKANQTVSPELEEVAFSGGKGGKGGKGGFRGGKGGSKGGFRGGKSKGGGKGYGGSKGVRKW